MLEDKFEEFAKFINEEKGKRKFRQSVELAINFKGLDFNKQDNRLNLEVLLPYGKGKSGKVAIFATDKSLIAMAQKNNIEVFDGSSIESIATDKAKLNSLLNYELLAQPNLMPDIARRLGQFLGPRNKMPKPMFGNEDLSSFAANVTKRIIIKNKGRFLPTVHCVVGSEDMKPEEIFDNVKEVLNSVIKKVSQNHIRSAYVKLSMSKPMKIM